MNKTYSSMSCASWKSFTKFGSTSISSASMSQNVTLLHTAGYDVIVGRERVLDYYAGVRSVYLIQSTSAVVDAHARAQILTVVVAVVESGRQSLACGVVG
jgi:hypothetical protein